MTTFSRREFGRTVLAGIPVAATLSAVGLRADTAVTVGVSTDSYRDLARVTGQDNVDEVIGAVQIAHATRIELAFAHLEPAPPPTAPFMGGSAAYPQRVVLTPEQILSMNAGARQALRTWRSQTNDSFFDAIRGKLSAAGLVVH